MVNRGTINQKRTLGRYNLGLRDAMPLVVLIEPARKIPPIVSALGPFRVFINETKRQCQDNAIVDISTIMGSSCIKRF